MLAGCGRLSGFPAVIQSRLNRGVAASVDPVAEALVMLLKNCVDDKLPKVFFVRLKRVVYVFCGWGAFFLVFLLLVRGIRLPSDYDVEKRLKDVLSQKTSLEREFPGGRLCFVQSYANPVDLGLYKDGFGWVYFNDLTGWGDDVWWLIVMQGNTVSGLYRMGSRFRPAAAIKGVFCVSSKEGWLSQSHKYGSVVYFDIKLKE